MTQFEVDLAVLLPDRDGDVMTPEARNECIATAPGTPVTAPGFNLTEPPIGRVLNAEPTEDGFRVRVEVDAVMVPPGAQMAYGAYFKDYKRRGETSLLLLAVDIEMYAVVQEGESSIPGSTLRLIETEGEDATS